MVGSSLRVFLASLTAAAVAVWFGVLWIGPSLVNLALLDDQRDQPYAVLDLTDLSDLTNQDTYKRVVSDLVTSEGGYVDPGYSLVHLLDGRRDVKFSSMQVITMQRGKSLVQVLTTGEYQQAIEVEPSRSIKLGSFSLPREIWPNTVVVWLAELRPDSHADVLRELATPDNLGDGVVLWDTYVDSLTKQKTQWDRLLVVGYEHEQQALEWLRKADVTTARLIVKANARNLAVAIYSR